MIPEILLRNLTKMNDGYIALKAPVMPLALSPANELLQVIEIASGAGLKKRLADLGIVPGAYLRLTSTGTAGPVILNIKESRLAIGRGIAQRIMVVQSNPIKE